MNHTALPEWWKDVERSRSGALAEYETVLSGLEAALAVSFDFGGRAASAGAERWLGLLDAAGRAADRLKSGMRLADSRAGDAAAMGLQIPSDPHLEERIESALRRSRAAGDEIRRRMALIAGELGRRRPRRPVDRSGRVPTPSLIDIQV